MDRLDLYRIFVRLVETRSFTRTADTLRMPRSTVSTAIADLETRLGARLLYRTTRSVEPTDEGRAFHDRCLAVLTESEEMETMFRRTPRQIEGRIRVDLPSRIGRLLVVPALPEFLAQWPGISVELGMSDRPVDLVGERVDLAVRVGPLPDSGLRARRLGAIAQINVASPAYLARYGVPLGPKDLDRHLQVAYAAPSTGRIMDWEWRGPRRSIQTRPVPWRVSANNAEGYIAAALAGMGMIQIPGYDVAMHLANGELVDVMPEHRAAPMPIHLLYPGGGQRVRRLSAFAEWLAPKLLAGVELGEP